MQQKTVFISYRRSISRHLARSVYQDLRSHNWDVFLDVDTIDSGNFDRIILNQIAARAHFILLISPGSLKRCANSGDWVLREIQEAVQLERNIVPIIEEGADFTEETDYLPKDIREVIRKKNGLPLSHFYFEPAMNMLRTRFLKTPEYVQIQEAPASDQDEVQKRLAAVEENVSGTAQINSLGLLPDPFDWIKIPKGSTIMDGQQVAVPSFDIAKYPVTNAQFRKFIESNGYKNENWWTQQGWQKKNSENWTEPRYWRDSKWNGDTQPIVGISWYEAVAFCHWLSQTTEENIELPTEMQWQYAAQGNDGRRHPWGNEWACERCNNSTGACHSQGTTHVSYYEGKGDSPFGVVDMAGNVWEWCLTDYENKTNHINQKANGRVLRGGSWLNDGGSGFFSCEFRIRGVPHRRNYSDGFRISRSTGTLYR